MRAIGNRIQNAHKDTTETATTTCKNVEVQRPTTNLISNGSRHGQAGHVDLGQPHARRTAVLTGGTCFRSSECVSSRKDLTNSHRYTQNHRIWTWQGLDATACLDDARLLLGVLGLLVNGQACTVCARL